MVGFHSSSTKLKRMCWFNVNWKKNELAGGSNFLRPLAAIALWQYREELLLRAARKELAENFVPLLAVRVQLKEGVDDEVDIPGENFAFEELIKAAVLAEA